MPRLMSHVIFAVFYHPPDAVSYVTTNHIVENVDSIIRHHPQAKTLIVGDFNKMADKPLRDLKLKQIVHSATRKSATLDNIYTNIGEWYHEPQILPGIGRSDHQSVVLLPVVGGRLTTGGRILTTVRSNDPNRKAELARNLAALDWSPMYDMASTETMTSYFYDVTTSMLNHYLPQRVVARHSTDKPWVTDEFRRLIRKRQYAWTNNNISEFRKLRNNINRLSRKLRKRFYDRKVADLRKCDAANWWRQTKILTGQSSKPDLVGMANDQTGGDVQELASRINVSLSNVSADLTRLNSMDEFSGKYVAATDDHQYTILPYEVFRKLEAINIRKAPGPDQLPNWFLRDMAFALAEPLCWIFNSSIKEGVVPTIWKQANIIPIPKSKPPKSIEQDLRPIALTPTISKILECLVGKWIVSAISDRIDKKQFGAIKGRSTTHALVDMTHKWHQALDEQQSVRVVFIDYAKAFDHVDHPTVLRKLAVLGVPPLLHRWLHSFLADRQQRVKIGQAISTWSSPNGGMPQGTWLGLYVFVSLINDLVSAVELHKFVDDCTLSEVVSADISIMQHEIDQLHEWSSNNHMNVNIKKTKEMLLGPISKIPMPNLLFDGQSVERVTNYKLLGLHVSNTLNWNKHVATICSKASVRLHFLKILKRAEMSVDDLTYFYESVIRPVTEYGCVVWHSSLTKAQTGQLEAIQRRAVRIIYGNSKPELATALKAMPSLSDRRDKLSRRFFADLQKPSSCLRDLLPAKRDDDIIGRLRQAARYAPPTARTERFKNSAIVYALNNYQLTA
jgi:hypothetical protein